MAKVKGPLLSVSATGKLADTIVYQRTPGGFKVNTYSVPHNPKTEAQRVHRQFYSAAVGVWKGFSEETKRSFIIYNPDRNISCYAFFISLFVTSAEHPLGYNSTKYFNGVYY